jgi:hypothetical protein
MTHIGGELLAHERPLRDLAARCLNSHSTNGTTGAEAAMTSNAKTNSSTVTTRHLL